jgi:hypothetical protein
MMIQDRFFADPIECWHPSRSFSSELFDPARGRHFTAKIRGPRRTDRRSTAVSCVATSTCSASNSKHPTSRVSLILNKYHFSLGR